MHHTMRLVFGCSVCLALVQAATRTVVVFRHTFRAPASTIKCTPEQNITDWGAFSAQPLPDFGTAAKNATARGLQLTADFAALLPTQLPQLATDTPVQLVYDSGALRDQETAEALAAGFGQAGLTDVTYTPNSSLFDVTDAGICSALSTADRTADVTSQMSVVPKPSNYDAVLTAMENILGTGNVTWTEIADYISGGYWEGRTCVAASFAEVFLFEYGSRLLVGWGRVDLDLTSTASNALFRLLENHVYYRSVNMKGPEVSRHDRSNMVNAVLRELDGGVGSAAADDPNKDTFTMLVGHDADVDQVSTLFNITFQLEPDNQNGVPPMSGLALTYDTDSGKLSAQYVGAIWDPENKTDLVLSDVLVVPAYFVNSNEELYVPITNSLQSEMQYVPVRKAVYERLDTACVQNLVSATWSPPVSPWVIVGCVAGAVVLVVIIVVVVWRIKAKPKHTGQQEPLVATTYQQ